ncbi:MAG: hypothetical protein RLZZ387_4505 [Chloroflexota bacterium]|jgi:hypothetical protein
MRQSLLSILITLLLLSALPTSAQAQTDQRCFPETGHCISGRIRQFWEQNGGLPVFGFPIGPQQDVTIEGKTFQAQNFERNRLELHPENAAPFDVLLGRLGADRLAQQSRDWFAFPKGGAQAGCRFFAETGHSVCGDILAAWRTSGLELDGRAGKSEAESLALFGLPLSGVVTEQLGDGREYQVQWFERARFEVHPENAAPFNVLLGLLGNELRDAAAAPAPTPAPEPQAPPPPREWAGEGTRVVDIALDAPSRLALSHKGDANFIVWAYGPNNYRELLVNTIADYQGVRWLPKGQYTMEIKADGEWRLAAAPLVDDNNDRVITGRGDYVSNRFTRPGRTVYTLQHEGDANFIVWLYCIQGSDLIANEIGPFGGEVVVEFPAGPCLWDVRSDGNWRVVER